MLPSVIHTLISNQQTYLFAFSRNNGFAISTPSYEQYKGDGIAARGPAYGIATIRVDGTDVFAVYNGIKLAREYTLRENKPVIFEAMAYRYVHAHANELINLSIFNFFSVGHHSTSDDSTAYRSAEEIEIWNSSEHPISKLKNYMIKQGWFNEEEENAFVKNIRKQILKQISVSEKKLKPNYKEMFEGVYDEMPDHLKEQLKELEQHVDAHKDYYPVKNFIA